MQQFGFPPRVNILLLLMQDTTMIFFYVCGSAGDCTQGLVHLSKTQLYASLQQYYLWINFLLPQIKVFTGKNLNVLQQTIQHWTTNFYLKTFSL